MWRLEIENLATAVNRLQEEKLKTLDEKGIYIGDYGWFFCSFYWARSFYWA